MLAIGLGGTGAAAEPMDLRNPEPRWVNVRFEMSPADLPGQTDTVYSDPVAAWLEPGSGDPERTVTIDGGVVEERLLKAKKRAEKLIGHELPSHPEEDE